MKIFGKNVLFVFVVIVIGFIGQLVLVDDIQFYFNVCVNVLVIQVDLEQKVIEIIDMVNDMFDMVFYDVDFEGIRDVMICV